MPRIVLSSSMLRDYARLPQDVAGKVSNLITNFAQQAFAGAHIETPKAARDPQARTVRIDNFWRGVVMAPVRGDTYFLLRVMAHDDAYTWAQRNLFRINSATGGIEVVDIAEAEAVADTLALAPAADDPLVFAGLSDKTLLDLGVASDVLPLVRTIRSDDQLEALALLLPLAQGEVLLDLAGGKTPEEVWGQLAGRNATETIDTGDFEAALQRDVTAAEFVTIDGPEELLDVLSKPLDLWRVFLHPDQRRLAYRATYSGPVRVTGGAGTGKTVVAMHRAKALADRLDRPVGKPILFTTFSRNLAQAIEADLRSHGSVLVAYSGGADSAFLLAAAVRALGPGRGAGEPGLRRLGRPRQGRVRGGRNHRAAAVPRHAAADRDRQAVSTPRRPRRCA